MGKSKIEYFSENQNKLAQFSKVISHPARVAILEFLIKRKQCICSDLVMELPLAQSTISQHLKELKKAGIIKGKISGNEKCYCINAEVWQTIKKELDNFFSQFEKNKEECCSD